MKSKLHFFVAILVFSLILNSCKREYYKPVGQLDMERIPSLTENLAADIYMDASYSMCGFVADANSHYIRTLELLERSLISSWPKSIRKFYKFGKTINGISRSEFLNARYPSFYRHIDYSGETRIEGVLDKAIKGNLTIIITDLLQRLADINLLVDKINNKFFEEKRISMGVLGIKSEFQGLVSPIGIRGLRFEYSTVNLRPKEYRPFYILLFGEHVDIRHFYENMNINGLAGFSEKNFIILSPQQVERLATFEGSTISKINKLKEVINLLDPRNPSAHVKQFVIQGIPEKSSFSTRTRLHPSDYTIHFDPKKIVPVVSSWRYDQKLFVTCETALNGINVKEMSINENILYFHVDIFPPRFPGNGVYCFEITAYPTQDAYALPQWISEWDMNQTTINNPGQFKGNCTANLKNFLNNIWQIIYQKYRPKIARLYFYLEKE